ncbi:MAG: TIGR04283 family arsenosugar biosynthesis glycosyltransferase [Acidobacteria bacterium]|nr:TIGR04283 family arsenosugar biosynthesis glycosyltransferase [Acidobacteriota bacterium]
MRVSVIIPVLNERDCLPAGLAALAGQPWVHEVIVVDGGSSDGTREWLAGQPAIVVIDSVGGKGNQINAGARTSSGDVLLLLHADCLLPTDAGVRLGEALKDEAVSAGCFCVQFSETRPRSLRAVAAGINMRTRLSRTATGDQAIFVRRRAFDQAGGCPDWPLFEDVDLVRRIKRFGRFRVIPSRVTLSPRRYLCRGVFRTALLILLLRLGFWAGISPFTLRKWFLDVRSDLQ